MRAVGNDVPLYCPLIPTRAPSLATANCCLHPAHPLPSPAFPDSQEIVTDALERGGSGTTWKASRGEGRKELETASLINALHLWRSRSYGYSKAFIVL